MKSIGIKLADGSFYPVMKEGSSEKTTLELTTVQDNQTTVQIDLYRSETDSMQDAEYVDSLEINLNPHPNGEPSLKLDLNLDDAGELHAEVNDPETGTSNAKQVKLISRTEEERMEPANFTVENSHSDFLAPPATDEDFSFDSINETSGILPPLEPIGDIFEDSSETENQDEMPLTEEASETLPLENEDDFFAENPPAELTQMFSDVTLPDLPEDIFADDDFPSEEGETSSETDALDSLDIENSSEEGFTDATEDFLSEEEFPVFEEESAPPQDNFGLPDIDKIMEDDSAEGVETDSTHIEDEAGDIITAQKVSSEELPLESFEEENETFDTEFPTETPSEDFAESSAESGVEEKPEDFEQEDFNVEEESQIQDNSIDVTDEFFDATDEFSEADEQFPIFEEEEKEEQEEVPPEPQFDLPDISELMNDTAEETQNLPLDLPDFSTAKESTTDDFESDPFTDTPDFTDDAQNFSDDTPSFDVLSFLDDDSNFSPFDEKNESEQSDFDSTFEIPDFGDSPAFSDNDSLYAELFDSSDDQSDIRAETESTSYSPQNNMFADLYDTETINGNSSQNDEYESEEKQQKNHTLAPVVICVVCAIICVLAALMVLFVIPSRLNILGKGEPLVTQTNATPQNTLDALDVELPPPDTSLPAAPQAQEDTIVVVHTPSTLVPEQPVRAQKTPEVIRYKIVWGDTLWDIANAYYKNPWRYKALAEYNHIANPDYIQAGRIIEIPAE